MLFASPLYFSQHSLLGSQILHNKKDPPCSGSYFNITHVQHTLHVSSAHVTPTEAIRALLDTPPLIALTAAKSNDHRAACWWATPCSADTHTASIHGHRRCVQLSQRLHYNQTPAAPQPAPAHPPASNRLIPSNQRSLNTLACSAALEMPPPWPHLRAACPAQAHARVGPVSLFAAGLLTGFPGGWRPRSDPRTLNTWAPAPPAARATHPPWPHPRRPSTPSLRPRLAQARARASPRRRRQQAPRRALARRRRQRRAVSLPLLQLRAAPGPRRLPLAHLRVQSCASPL